MHLDARVRDKGCSDVQQGVGISLKEDDLIRAEAEVSLRSSALGRQQCSASVWTLIRGRMIASEVAAAANEVSF